MLQCIRPQAAELGDGMLAHSMIGRNEAKHGVLLLAARPALLERNGINHGCCIGDQ